MVCKLLQHNGFNNQRFKKNKLNFIEMLYKLLQTRGTYAMLDKFPTAVLSQ